MYRYFPVSIELTRLHLSPLRREHAGLVFHTYASKPEVTKYLLWQAHESVEETERFLRLCESGWRAGTIYNYGIWLNPAGTSGRGYSRLAGSIGLHRSEDGSFQLGYALSPTVWGRGLATEAAKGVVAAVLAKEQHFGLWSFVHPDHQASARVLEKAGFATVLEEDRCFVFPSLGPDPVAVRCFRHSSTRV